MGRDILEQTMSVGDMIGRAIRVYRLNLRSWVPILIWPTIICMVGRVLFQGATAYIPVVEGKLPLQIGLAAAAFVGLTIWFLAKWVIIVRQLAFVRIANGFSDSLTEALDYMKSRQWSVAGIFVVLSFIMSAVGGLWLLELIASGMLYKRDTLLALVSTTGLGFGFIVGFLSLSFIYYVQFIILSGIACEKIGLTAMISRGFKLASKAVFRTLYLGLMISLTVYFISIPLWLPPLLLIGLDALRVGADLNLAEEIPIFWQVISSAWEPLVEMIIWPISSLTFGYFYYDLRLRQEAVDVILHLDAKGTEPRSEVRFS
ncbi:hypothetical protein GC174_04335 [bacterium]|nr:hypothetical protein [bacterium]